MFKLYASGDLEQLNYFLKELESNERLNVAVEAKEYYDKEHGNRGKIVMSVEMKTDDLVTVILETQNGTDVKISLKHVSVVELEGGIMSVSGLAHDIFG